MLPIDPSFKYDERFSRLSGEEFVPTVTCGINPMSRIVGKTLHYREDRVMTILEAKRAQGFLDTDVLIGAAAKAFKIVGNSVCRQVAFALGERLADAVRNGPDPTELRDPVLDKISATESVDKKVMLASRSMKFMVLIEQKRPKTLNSTIPWKGDNLTKSVNGREVYVDFKVRNIIDRVEIFVANPRKRIRVAVEEDPEEL